MKQPNGYWTDNTILERLKQIINKINHFPTSGELKSMGENTLLVMMTRKGGTNKFRILMGHDLIYNRGHWTKENIINDLKQIIFQIGHFPSQDELILLNKGNLVHAIQRNGGYPEFRLLMNYDYLHKPKGYWTDNKIILELKLIINKLGHFPNISEIKSMNNIGLLHAIHNNGGIIKFKIIMGIELIRNYNGYWTEETIIRELKNIISEIGHFPSETDLSLMNKNDLIHGITRNGGFPKFHNLLGYTSLHEKYLSELQSYVTKKGRKTESFIKEVLMEYCVLHNLSLPLFNKKLSKGNVLEFVCNTGKTIGIDVTNTIKIHCVTNKWLKKSYHLHLDELWIVVFSNVFTEKDYNKFNEESPENVKIFSVYGFLDELDYSLDIKTKSKIDKYCSCTFHTKEELQNKNNMILKS